MQQLPEAIEKFRPIYAERQKAIKELENCKALKPSLKHQAIEELKDKTLADAMPFKREFGMWVDENVKALRKFILNDPDRPKMLSGIRVWDLFTVMALHADRDGIIHLSVDEMAEETGLSKNNVYSARKYLRQIGALLGDERGSVPMPSLDGVKEAASLYYGKYKLYQ